MGDRGLKRLNYHAAPKPWDGLLRFATPRIRRLAAHAVAVATALIAVQLIDTIRFAGLRDAAAGLRVRAERATRPARPGAAADTAAGLHDRSVAFAAARTSGTRAANLMARVGNALPPGAVLAALRSEPGALTVEGTGRGLEAVGDAIASLAAMPGARAVRLRETHRDAADGVAYTLVMERVR